MTRAAAEIAPPVVFGGRYAMQRSLATGGMAEIYLARQQSLDGFDKDVVIKRLLGKYRDEPRVRQMFLDEARIGAILNHPNVVHVYDVGEHEGIPFIAMEYVDGQELAELCQTGIALGAFLPLEHAIDLVRQAAEGMGYFHNRKDDAGKLAIVHRDISPTNLLVTREGHVKIIDFGVARSRWASSHDDLVPGKYSYMAPEQIKGEPVDARADVFSLGVVLYEITVGRRLFKGPAPEVIQRITQHKFSPPTFVRKEFPPALETIVMRALERRPEDRYASAYQLADELESFLRDSGRSSGPIRIAQYLSELAEKSGGERRPELEIAGEAWGAEGDEEALDFDRSFAQVKSEVEAALSGKRAGVTGPVAIVDAGSSSPVSERPALASPESRATDAPPERRIAPSERSWGVTDDRRSSATVPMVWFIVLLVIALGLAGALVWR